MESEQELRIKARKRAEDKVGFYVHFGIYILVNTALWLLWWITTPEVFPWPIFITLFWGIGVGSHAVGTFAGHSFTEDLAEKEYQKLKGRQ
jgi:hypothetical protein